MLKHLPIDVIIEITLYLLPQELVYLLSTSNWLWNLRHRTQYSTVVLLLWCIKKKYNRKALQIAVTNNWVDIIEVLVYNKLTNWNEVMTQAAKQGKMTLVELCLFEKEVQQIDSALIAAAQGGHKDMVIFFMEMTATKGIQRTMEEAMVQAVKYGHRDIIELFWSLGYVPKERCFNAACQRGDLELVSLFFKKNYGNKLAIMQTVISKGHKDVVVFLESQGITFDKDWCMMHATEKGRHELVEYYISRGATNWNLGLCQATYIGRRDLVDLFIAKGADDWNTALRTAQIQGLPEFAALFREKIAASWKLKPKSILFKLLWFVLYK